MLPHYFRGMISIDAASNSPSFCPCSWINHESCGLDGVVLFFLLLLMCSVLPHLKQSMRNLSGPAPGSWESWPFLIHKLSRLQLRPSSIILLEITVYHSRVISLFLPLSVSFSGLDRSSFPWILRFRVEKNGINYKETKFNFLPFSQPFNNAESSVSFHVESGIFKRTSLFHPKSSFTFIHFLL